MKTKTGIFHVRKKKKKQKTKKIKKTKRGNTKMYMELTKEKDSFQNISKIYLYEISDNVISFEMYWVF